MDSIEPKRRGRPPMFAPERKRMQDVHLMMASNAWTALRAYAESIGELSLSAAARRLLRERLTELGYLTERPNISQSR